MDGDFLGRGRLLLREVFRFDDGLIDEAVKPGVRHDVITLGAARVTPRVLNLPFKWATIFEVDTDDDHRMVHRAMAEVEHCALIEFKGEAKRGLIVEGLIVPSVVVLVAEETDIASKPDDFAGKELTDDGVLEVLHLDVEVVDELTLEDIAKLIDREVAQERLVGGWRIDEGLIFVDLFSDVFVEEGLRGESLLMELFLGVDVFEFELLGWHAKGIEEEAVDALHRLVLQRADFRFPSFGGKLMGLIGEVADDRVHEEVRLAGVIGLECLWEAIFGHKAVLLHEVDEHIPLSAIGYGIIQDELEDAFVGGILGEGDDRLEGVVGFLDFVKKGDVVLAELERWGDVELLRDDFAKDIETRKDPAAPAGLLVGDGHRLHFVREGEVRADLCRWIVDRGGHRAARQGVADDGIGPILFVFGLNACAEIFIKRTFDIAHVISSKDSR